MVLKMSTFLLFAVFVALSAGQNVPAGQFPVQNVPPGQFFFGGNCKSKGCGVQSGAFGDVFFGGACKSKGCPMPPGVSIPGIPTTPLPPAPPVCCSPDGCLNGYRTECVVGALSPRLAAQGYFAASGSCSGRFREFNCRSADAVCSGNRNRCRFRPCARRPRRPAPRPSRRPAPRPSRRPAPRPSRRPAPRPSRRPAPRPSRRPRPSSRPTRPKRKSKAPYHSYRSADEYAEFGDEGPVVDADDRYMQLIDRMINVSRNVPQDMLPVEMRQFGGGFGACKSKGCPFGVFPGAGGAGQLQFGGSCKSKGCGIVNGVYFGGACKSKGCPLPPGFEIGSPSPVAEPSPRALPPRVPDFKPPGRRDCCFARPCDTQRICRCVLNQ